MDLLFKLRDAGNTVLIIEHDLDVIRLADWIIELGPEGGEGGGEIVFAGDVATFVHGEQTATQRVLAAAAPERRAAAGK